MVSAFRDLELTGYDHVLTESNISKEKKFEFFQKIEIFKNALTFVFFKVMSSDFQGKFVCF